ncbi:glycosyltransferase family 4 protein [Granulicella sp. WH15]|uniref:glycosyltransferase n=1 Tax=Granulicella sp. WH15 TaxID=2602070 RepID=UPI00136695FB|nr:glycosyltransferase [Granulicella sp. WH15]QHN02123.1 glycosyltransferase family 4 protein [Granulicella sp. WH15]
MRVAIVHHWFVTRGGGERVAECIASLFPEAEIFTLVSGEEGLPESLASRKLHTSFLQKLPFGKSHHRHMMPLYPAATEGLDLRGFGLVISSDSGPMKGVRLDPGAVHFCYCHSPMRYLYDSYDAYRSQMRGLTRALFTATAGRLRRWDTQAAQRVDYFIANSNYVAKRIQRFYNRESTVIHPPIDLHRAQLAAAPGDHYLCAGRLVGYKQTELLMEACRRLGRKLRIVGTGPEEAKLRRLAAADAGSQVEFLGALPSKELWREYSECRALLFAADEDFGMVPLEAQACGRPVICYGSGGSLETVRGTGDHPTGVYFEHQTVESAMEGIQRFEAQESRFTPETAQAWAAEFATPVFLERMRALILEKVPAAAAEMEPAPTIASAEKRA